MWHWTTTHRVRWQPRCRVEAQLSSNATTMQHRRIRRWLLLVERVLRRGRARRAADSDRLFPECRKKFGRPWTCHGPANQPAHSASLLRPDTMPMETSQIAPTHTHEAKRPCRAENASRRLSPRANEFEMRIEIE